MCVFWLSKQNWNAFKKAFLLSLKKKTKKICNLTQERNQQLLQAQVELMTKEADLLAWKERLSHLEAHNWPTIVKLKRKLVDEEEKLVETSEEQLYNSSCLHLCCINNLRKFVEISRHFNTPVCQLRWG